MVDEEGLMTVRNRKKKQRGNNHEAATRCYKGEGRGCGDEKQTHGLD